ncbi:MAG: hypothetical protein B9S34_02960 [Opitutia bacterium Tous-C1TDCM]|nr:MAG: hypothetical protein B9S34_02960 [Opitutae bacterium Tous-C1TDCM]
MNRRSFLSQTAAASAAAVLASRLRADPARAAAMPKGKAEHCIFIWLGGGMSQIDTFDPKVRGNPKSKPSAAGSDYAAIDTAVPGVRFTEHLAQSARLADRITAVRTVNHRLGIEHALATNFVHTGRAVSGSTIYPSVGSVVAHERGAAGDQVPAYLLIGYPSVSRGPGFLGAKHGYIYLVDTESGPAGFTPPDGIDAARVAERRRLLAPLQGRVAPDSSAADYEIAQREALRLAGPGFMRNFRLDEEPGSLRQRYGGEFGQRCLLSRRLVQAGVRFIEVSHNLNFINGAGWDTHNAGQLQQHALIRELDTALSALIADLEDKRLLDKTLIAIGTEFGRPGQFDSGGGRGHQSAAFSLVLAGGGLNHRGAYGVTDAFSNKVVENPVSVPDFHATIYAALGINPAKELVNASRPVPITDGGKPIAALFS